jgi:DNA-directed RNA polymerase subunit RPC12/RpoP/predicted transcriptional regulator
MPGQGRTLGIILIAIAAIVLVVAALWLVVEPLQAGGSIGGALLGLMIVLLIFVLPIGAAGVYLLTKSNQEATQYAEIAQQKKILNMVLTQGKVSLSDVAVELDLPIDTVENMVRDLVGKNLFSGAINWKDGILYSKQASELKTDRKCPNCGGQLELVGKGVIECPFCGSDVFLAT